MEKLNLQAHQNAMFNTDEYVLEAILTFDKFEVVIVNMGKHVIDVVSCIMVLWLISLCTLLDSDS